MKFKKNFEVILKKNFTKEKNLTKFERNYMKLSRGKKS